MMIGKPVIAGTRITVELIVEKLGAGESIEQIVDAFKSAPDPRGGPHCPLVRRAAATRGGGLCRAPAGGLRHRGMKLVAAEGVDRQIIHRLRRPGSMSTTSPGAPRSAHRAATEVG